MEGEALGLQDLPQDEAVLFFSVRRGVQSDAPSGTLREGNPLWNLGLVEGVQQMLRLEAQVGLECHDRGCGLEVGVHLAALQDVVYQQSVRLLDVCAGGTLWSGVCML